MGDLSSLGSMFSGASSAAGAIPDITSSVPDWGSTLGSTLSQGANLAGPAASAVMGAPSAMNFGSDINAIVGTPNVIPSDAFTTAEAPGVAGINTAGMGMGIGGPGIVGSFMDPSTMLPMSGGSVIPSATSIATAGGFPDPGTSAYNPIGVNQSVNPVDVASSYAGVGAPGGGGNFLQSLFSNPNAIKALGSLGLAGMQMMNDPTKASINAARQMATQQGQVAKNQTELAMAEQQGLLPAGAQGLFQGVLSANEAAVRAKYAQMGMTGSTAEMQDLNAVRDATMMQILKQGADMANTAWGNVKSATGIEAGLLNDVMTQQMNRNQELLKLLSQFGGAAADAWPTMTAGANPVPATSGGTQ